MTYYKVKTARELIPDYADYIKQQIFDAYIVDPHGPLAKQVPPNPIPKKSSRPKVRLPWKYDEPIGNNGKFIEKKFVNVDRDKVILDCACGGGAQMDQLKRMGFKYVVGAELSSKFLATAKTAADGVLKADMHWLGYRNETFDYICSFHTVEHAYFPSVLLHEFFRVLKKDGRLFVIIPYPDAGQEDDFHVAKYELGTNILDQGKSVLKFFVANGFRPTIIEHSKGLANEPLLWCQFRKRLHIRGKPFTEQQQKNIFFPQKHLLEGELPFNLKPKDSNERIDIWFISTKIAVPEVIFKGEVPLYPFYWDTPETPEWTPRHEFIVGIYNQDGKHGYIHRKWGTQPLNTYLRGHFCLKPHPRAEQEGEHVLIQQYFKSGWWGSGNRITIKEQLQQNKIGLQLLRQLGILKPGVNFHFFDQTKPTQDTFGLEYFLFKAETLPDSYNKHLPQYLREWRKNDFPIPIEEVIQKYVNPNLP